MYKKICPKCKEETEKYHLMMVECDDCINKICKENKKSPQYYKLPSGLFVLNGQAGSQ